MRGEAGTPKPCTCPRVRHEHGTAQAYHYCGCRCQLCRDAYRTGRGTVSCRSVQMECDAIAVELACYGRARASLTWVEKREAIRRLAAWGLTDRQIAARIGSTPDAVLKMRHRHSIRPGYQIGGAA